MVDTFVCSHCGTERLGKTSIGGDCSECISQGENKEAKGAICYECWALGLKFCKNHIPPGKKCNSCKKKISFDEVPAGHCKECEAPLCNECLKKGIKFCDQHDPVQMCINLVEEKFSKYLRSCVSFDELVELKINKGTVLKAFNKMQDTQDYSVEKIKKRIYLTRK